MLDARGQRPRPRLGIYQLDLGVDPKDYDRRFTALIDRVDDYRRVTPVEVDGGLPGERGTPPGPCFWLGNALAIDCGGDAYTCLLATATKLGSILDTPPDALLTRARSLREIVAVSGRRAITGCRRCRKCEGSAAQAA